MAELTPGADADGVYEEWFTANNADYAVVRPDFYVYGVARGQADLGALLDRFEQQLTGSAPGTSMVGV